MASLACKYMEIAFGDSAASRALVFAWFCHFNALGMDDADVRLLLTGNGGWMTQMCVFCTHLSSLSLCPLLVM
jgi:hypothetical protein